MQVGLDARAHVGYVILHVFILCPLTCLELSGCCQLGVKVHSARARALLQDFMLDRGHEHIRAMSCQVGLCKVEEVASVSAANATHASVSSCLSSFKGTVTNLHGRIRTQEALQA